MALARVKYTQSTSGNRNFTVTFPYISRDHVKVSVNDQPVSFTWTNNATVILDTAPLLGDIVEVYRVTERNNLLVDFNDGSTLTESQLQLSASQSFYIAQEAFDVSDTALNTDFDDMYFAGGRRIRGLGDAVEDQDAYTKGQADERFANDVITKTGGHWDAKGLQLRSLHTRQPPSSTDAMNFGAVSKHVSDVLNEADPQVDGWQRVRWVNTVADLLALDTSALVDGQVANVSGSSLRWDASLSEWTPLSDISVRAFGATGSGDDTAACQAALDFMASFATEQGGAPKAGKPIVRFDNSPTGVFPTTDTLNVSRLVDVVMIDPIEYSGPSDRPAMVHGEPGKVTWYPLSTYRVARASAIWHLSPKPRGEETDVGLVLYNFNSARSTVAQAHLFEIGVKMVGSSAGFSYSHFNLGYLESNKVQQWLYSENNGWINENSFFGGRFSRIGSRIGNTQTCGIRSLRGTGSTSTHNNNTWYSPSFEGHGQGVGENQPVIDAEHFNCCRILYCRDENNGPVFLKEGEDCRDSEVSWGFLLGGDRSTGRGRIDNTNCPYPTSFYSVGVQGKVFENHNRLVWDSGNMGDVACPVNGDRVYVPGVHLVTVSDVANPFEAQGTGRYISIEGGGIKINNTARSFGIGIELGDSVESKSLYVKLNAPGVLYTVCYDENMNHMSPYDPGNESLVRGRIRTPPYRSPYFMGSMATSRNDEFFIVMSPAVKYVYLAVAPGAAVDSVYKRMTVYSSAFGNSVPFLPGDGHVSTGVVGTSPPTQGNSRRGQFILNREPSAGSPYGWRCLESGNPGVWEPVNLTNP